MKRNCLLDPIQVKTIKTDEIPETVDMTKTLEKFDQYAYHLGGWPFDLPTKSFSPPVDEASHVVRSIELNDDGSISVSFEIIDTLRGYDFKVQYEKGESFAMIPVVDESGTTILRFDINKEK
jgi:hypothetical protein